jgi:hypothetical protein
MATRDPVKTARNEMIQEMKGKLRALLPQVLRETGISSETSLNAVIGGKVAAFIDLHHEQIHSADAYVSLYLNGFKAAISSNDEGNRSHRRNYEIFKKSKAAREYFMLFLKRAYLKHYDELSRKRPHLDESEIWIGQNRANYGLLITPRFVNGRWENDKSEIRHFPKLYWTIGHVLLSGLVVENDPDRVMFPNVNAYLTFFKNTLVRVSGSQYERAIANLYVEYARSLDDPEKLPLLMPEYRYGGKQLAHKYRLDFTIINPFTMDKVGYELSPWSTHGYLRALKGLTQEKINEMARDNFEKEIEKHRSFFRQHGIFALIYTDKQLENADVIFRDMIQYLKPANHVAQPDFHLLNKFFDT